MQKHNDFLARRMIQKICLTSTQPIHLMEFCGGHTVAILKNGLRQLLPETVHLFSGPGCPVCVTAAEDIDKIIELSHIPGVITVSFGDLLRIPGTYSSLQQSRAEGNDIRIVYSALEALDLAKQYPQKRVVMVGIGFETTAPTLAASILQAKETELPNYLVLSLHKLTPPIIRAILEAGETRIQGIICPGHVSTIIGSQPYDFIPRNYGIACAITGFEIPEILLGIGMLVRQFEHGLPKVENAYLRAVRPEGNKKALELMERVFENTGATWRGIGFVPGSGLRLKPEYQDFDAEKVLGLPRISAKEPDGCICGEILRGVKTPAVCPYFKNACTPEHPVGPCMVSGEGVCSAYYLYGDGHG
jgi:hydrogenase expression/formation protein HypD